jgi:hypothetical protein
MENLGRSSIRKKDSISTTLMALRKNAIQNDPPSIFFTLLLTEHYFWVYYIIRIQVILQIGISDGFLGTKKDPPIPKGSENLFSILNHSCAKYPGKYLYSKN